MAQTGAIPPNHPCGSDTGTHPAPASSATAPAPAAGPLRLPGLSPHPAPACNPPGGPPRTLPARPPAPPWQEKRGRHPGKAVQGGRLTRHEASREEGGRGGARQPGLHERSGARQGAPAMKRVPGRFMPHCLASHLKLPKPAAANRGRKGRPDCALALNTVFRQPMSANTR